MKQYENKEELKEEIRKTYKKYIDEFNDIDESLKNKRIEEVDRTPAENLSYQVGWTTLLLKWEEDEKKGIQVKTPSDKFKWNELGKLYEGFNQKYSKLSLEELKNILDENVNKTYKMIDNMTEDELFKPHMRKWADGVTKTAVWEVYKFININTVAPFKTFRTKIRKYKKFTENSWHLKNIIVLCNSCRKKTTVIFLSKINYKKMKKTVDRLLRRWYHIEVVAWGNKTFVKVK